MHRLSKSLALFMLTLGIASLAGCAPTTAPPAQAPSRQTDEVAPAPSQSEFYARISSSDYGQWATAPGYEMPQAAKGPHGDKVQIFMNDVAAAAYSDKAAAWPEDALIIKDIYTGGSLSEIAAMEKRGNVWYWGEWNGDGQVVVEGEAAEPCQGCHNDGTDSTLSITLGR